MKRRVHAYFSGTVQGVGFRYTTQDVAVKMGLKGWVKNLRDGRVELVAEGSEEELENLLASLKNSLGCYVRDADMSWSEATNEFSGFNIAF